MDLQSGIVCALVFVASAVLLLLISKFGMREKSYEEALAEQRMLTSGLLGPQHRPKAKEKKPKKAGKKVKERAPSTPTAVETSTEESETADGTEPTLKHHVEFEEPAVLESAQTNNNKKRAKKEKVKPILVNKDKSPVHEVDLFKNQSSTNHFEQIHPKDDFELLSSHHHKEEPLVVEPEVKTKKSKQDESKVSKSKEKKQSAIEKKSAPPAVVPLKEPAVQEQQIVAKVQQPQQQMNGVKDKKKKKSEFNTLQQLTAGDKHDVNVSLLVALVRKSDLSRSEIQILIDLLLNKQHEAPAVIDEWSEGRTDPVQKLKKQLAEKERALAEEQEAVVSAQAKLRELRAELNQERSRSTQNCRNLEESLLAKRTEVQSVTARMHAQGQQCQQLQVQLNEEMVKMRAMADELKAMQIQRQQLDMHINQKQEAEASFQSQLGQLRSELQETQALNGQLNMDLRTIREKNHAEKEMLHERIRQIETQAVHYKNESDQKQDLLMQLEDSRRMFSELEHRFNVTHRNENELKMMCQQHLDEARRQDMSATKTHDDIAALQSEITRLTVLNQSQDADNKRIIVDLQSQLSSIQADGVEDKSKDVEIRNLHNELSSLRGTLAQREAGLNTELDSKKKMLQELQSELTAQKSKNDELRKKNWRIMDALNDTENALRKEIGSKSKDGNDIAAKKLQIDEHAKYKSFLLRLFPEIAITDSDNWLTEAEKRIKTYVTELQIAHQDTEDVGNHSEEVERLQAELGKYRTIIDDTESSLKQIQSEVGNAESKWRQQLDEKELEIGQLKEYHSTQLQAQLDELTEQLKAERHTRIVLSEKLQSSAGDSLASVEQMVEEKSRLAEDLVREQKRSQDFSEEIQRLKTLTESQPIKAVLQTHTANGTTLEMSSSDLPTTTSSNSPTTKPRNKNKKKKTATVN